jgi:hypothetical protein
MVDFPSWLYHGDVKLEDSTFSLSGFRKFGSIKTNTFKYKNFELRFKANFENELQDGVAVVDIDFDDPLRNWCSIVVAGKDLALIIREDRSYKYSTPLDDIKMGQWNSFIINVEDSKISLNINESKAIDFDISKFNQVSISFSNNSFNDRKNENIENAFKIQDICLIIDGKEIKAEKETIELSKYRSDIISKDSIGNINTHGDIDRRFINI